MPGTAVTPSVWEFDDDGLMRRREASINDVPNDESERRIRGPLAGLSSQQLAGQRAVFSYPGLTVPSALLQQISAGEAAGVIFFGENISSDAQIASVIQQLRQAQQQSPVPVPLLLMTDQEGGLVRRLPGEPVLPEKQIGQSADPAAAASQAGTGAGQNLASVGMNLNLAPVLDVFYKPGNFIDQFQRSYSNNPQIVTSCGQAFITAQQQTGVAATAKHFPGLGSATKSQNTDTGPVTLKVSLPTLRSAAGSDIRA
jgi:beta-N-acetylhexosaminidase